MVEGGWPITAMEGRKVVPKQWELFLIRMATFFEASPGGDVKIVSTVAVTGLKSLSTLQFSYHYTFHSVPIS